MAVVILLCDKTHMKWDIKFLKACLCKYSLRFLTLMLFLIRKVAKALQWTKDLVKCKQHFCGGFRKYSSNVKLNEY